MELEQRLGLYQVFIKLYEHHRSLLDEILQLETPSYANHTGVKLRYVQGVVRGEQVYLVTNLLGGKTQTLLQPQCVWTLGRGHHVAISIPDKRLSRQHAAIQYIEKQGFYLIDLNSTNGSFVNGEPVYQRSVLKDGDRVRLSSLAFSFFLCDDSQTIDSAPPGLLEHLNALAQLSQSALARKASLAGSPENWPLPLSDNSEDTELFLAEQSATNSEKRLSKLQTTQAQQSEILDRFFKRQIPTAGERSQANGNG